MILYLLRHVRAAARGSDSAADSERALSAQGQQQAQAIATALRDAGIRRFLTSPARRCVETLAPLVGACAGASAQVEPRLLEGAPLTGLLDLVAELGDEPTLFCSHGDLIPALLEHFQRAGLQLVEETRCQPGSAWLVEGQRGAWRARYLPPPDVTDS